MTISNQMNLHQSLKDKNASIKRSKDFTLFLKLIILSTFIFLSTSSIGAQKGLFIKVSVGPGYTKEFSKLNDSGLAIITKNHAIGWGFTNKFSIQIGEFGALIKQNVGNYKYINLDAFGLGFSYRTPFDLKISILGAYSYVYFANKWTDSTGDKRGNGYGVNLSLDKEWFIGKRWGVSLGPQIFYLNTTDSDYEFLNISFNFSLLFYLNSMK